ncbi:tumor necrosis factor ligand superfamily member 13B isoform 1-T2 [Synchiropus picturatus]
MAPAWGSLKSGLKDGERRLSWPVLLLTLAALTSSSLSAVTLYQLAALRAEVQGLQSEACRRREQAQDTKQSDNMSSRRVEPLQQHDSHHGLMRNRRTSGGEAPVPQPCLQMLANHNRKTFTKGSGEVFTLPHCVFPESDFDLERHTGIPWKTGLQRGSALEAEGDSMLVKEEGFYFVYGQVYYMDSTFAMGHVLIRRKRNVVGDEPQYVILFRCIQNMDPVYPYNTCYTGGIVKLEAWDRVELLIPRSTANVSLDGDATFMGAVKLA